MNTIAGKSITAPTTSDVSAGFCRKMVDALAALKVRLQERYELVLPGRSQFVDEVIAESEALAWTTPFPHLLLPDFVQARLEALFPDQRELAFARVS